MRTLSEITSAVRLAEPVTDEELRYTVVAYDVLLAALQLEQDVPRLQAYMVAAMADPHAFIGPGNDPATEEGVAWYRAFITAGQPLPPTLTDTVCSICRQPFAPVANQPPVVTCPGCSEEHY